METGFYMLYAEGGGAPTYKHGTLSLAEEEAKRLAIKTGKEIFVLATVAKFKEETVKRTPCVLHDSDDLPF